MVEFETLQALDMLLRLGAGSAQPQTWLSGTNPSCVQVLF